ncbi:AIPR family protein [Pullulanibacillus sp. KACC 23026]|uniref:AIPR family protein n=1 Tax=Pullulanibacillus sp. KACC 23026 TaxID=3028315 RepID=UPI0023AF5CBB|nr:AIPR family protein [Pullulanibacillus sp. KACC 23026]WEG11146.1 AIPR family protein [Pullulanibacillus sp. KACC 23026]
MNIKHELLTFYLETMENIKNSKTRKSPFEAFLEEYLTYIETSNVPIYVEFFRPNLNIQVDAYLYDEDQKELTLYLMDFNEYMDYPEEISMTVLKELANKAKRFYTQYSTIPIDPSHPIMDLIRLLNDKSIEIDKLTLSVFTNKYYRSNKPIELTIGKNIDVDVQVWDIDRINQIAALEQDSSNIIIDFESEFNETFELIYVPQPKQSQTSNKVDCYIGYISAELLAKVYDKWGPKLVERNVRSFLQARGATNKGIKDTLKNDKEKEMFVVYNNGISSVAHSGNIAASSNNINLFEVHSLEGWQIVNGGQTTASIHQAYKAGIDLSDVYVQTKLTILQLSDNENAKLAEEDMVSKISKYANTQNKINQSDLLANTRFMSSLEHFSRTVWIPSQDNRKAESKWYFERSRGQYMVDLNRRKRGKEQTEFKREFPKELKLDKVDLAKNFMSWEGYPHISSKGGEEAFKKFMELNKKYWKYEARGDDKIDELVELTPLIYKELIAKVIINRRVQEMVNSLGLKGYKANVVYYTTAMLNLIYGDSISLEEVWGKQVLSDKWDNVIKEIAQRTLEYLRDSAGEQNVTQWAKKEECWTKYHNECKKQLKYII